MMRHIGTSIDGLLSQSDRQLKKLAPHFFIDGEPCQTAGQVRSALLEAKEEGMELIPAKECDNYDEKGWCRGHENA